MGVVQMLLLVVFGSNVVGKSIVEPGFDRAGIERTGICEIASQNVN